VTEAVRSAAADGCDLLLIRVGEPDLEQCIYDVAAEVDLPVVVWAQNFPTLRQLDAAATHPIVKRLVCVGREELDRHRDHPAFEKSTYIYNGLDPDLYAPDQHEPGDGTTVVYLGGLIRAKGFHRLARVWPAVETHVPGARLVVVGSGKLYDRNAEVGEWGIAAESYEQKFRPYLSGEDGAPRSSVEFKGNLGTEKIPVLQNADVGVVNPTGLTETFCWAGVEFQAAGTPVISAREWGLLDTVQDGRTGILIETEEQLADAISTLLGDREKRTQFGRNGMQFVRDTFSYRTIAQEWSRLFQDVALGKEPTPEPIRQNLFYRQKWLKEVLRRVKRHVSRFENLPPLFARGKRALVKEGLKSILQF
jgi:glycosyltransferase involved in cell wall biosynthesis